MTPTIMMIVPGMGLAENEGIEEAEDIGGFGW
jgi:hypothetical protein